MRFVLLLAIFLPTVASAIVYTPPLGLLEAPAMEWEAKGDNQPVSLGPWGTVVVDAVAMKAARGRHTAPLKAQTSRVTRWLRADGPPMLAAGVSTASVALAQGERRRAPFRPEWANRL